MRSSVSFRWAGMVSLIAVAAIRIAIVFAVGNPSDRPVWDGWTLDPDSHGYLAFSRDLADGRQDSASTRTPGYPVFLTLTSPEPGRSSLPSVLLQQAADLATAILIGMSLSGVLGGKRWYVSVYYAVLPAVFITSSRILPDSLLALATIASGCLWLLAYRSENPRKVILLHALIGLVCSVGVLVKPVYLFAPFVYALLTPALKLRHRGVRAAAMLVLAVFAGAGPLLLRHHNKTSFGLDAVSAQEGYEQAGRVWVLTGRVTQLEFVTQVKDSVEAVSTVDGRADYALRSSIYRSMAIQEFRRDPWAVIIPHLTSFPRFFSTGVGNTLRYFGLPGNHAASTPIKAITAVILFMMPLGLLAGFLIKSVRDRMMPVLLLAVAWMIVMIPVHGPLAGPRYGLVFFPVLAAAGVGSLLALMDRGLAANSVKEA